MKRTLIAQVEDKPGVLNRVASLFRRRAFNIESLTVGHTEQPGISRMTIVVDSTRTDSQKVAQHLCKLINVIKVEDITDARFGSHQGRDKRWKDKAGGIADSGNLPSQSSGCRT